LASLEVLVHLEPDELPLDLLAIEIDVPDALETARFTPSQLPRFWRRYPAPRSLQKLGNAWLDNRKCAVLRLPSAIIPGESTFLINPLHPDARQITVAAKSRFAFDLRLIRRGRGQS
jgi:RES domain-containing protein